MAISDAAGEAFNNMFHKCRAEVSMDWWQRIWSMAVRWAWENPQSDAVPTLRSALNAMLTQFGMDEDEWSKPTFDQARRALAAPGAAIAAREQETVAREDFDRMSADLTRAKNLLVNLYDQLARDPSPEKLRGMIEKRTGSWFVWGADRDALASPKEAPATPQGAEPSAVTDEQIRRLFVERGHLYAGWLELGRSILSLRPESPAEIYAAPAPASEVVAWLNPETGDCVSVKCRADWASAYGENAGNVYSVPLIAALTQPTTVQQAETASTKGSKANSDLIRRIDLAISRITSGQAPMRIPVDHADPDIVLADCREALKGTQPGERKEGV